MKNIALIIMMLGVLAIGSSALAFNVTVSSSDASGHENETYQIVEMQPVNDQGTASAQADDTGKNTPIVAEKE